MCEDRDPVSTWIADLQRGDNDAVRRLFDQYFERLLVLAARRIQVLRSRAKDEQDIVQSALGSFCRAAREGRLSQLADQNDVQRLLRSITTRKAVEWLRHELAAKRGGGMVQGESALSAGDSSSAQSPINRVLSDSPTPEAILMTAERWQQLFDMLPDDQCRQIVWEKLDGRTNAEIANLVGCKLRTVERRLKLIRSIWEHEVAIG